MAIYKPVFELAKAVISEEIYQLTSSKEFRNQGIGFLLLTSLIEWAEKKLYH